MTHLIFLYLLKYKKLYEEGEEIVFDENDLLKYGQIIEEAKGGSEQQGIFH